MLKSTFVFGKGVSTNLLTAEEVVIFSAGMSPGNVANNVTKASFSSSSDLVF